MPRRILWLDNDSANTRPYVSALSKRGDDVQVVTTISQAEDLLVNQNYDLLILDVMIPTRDAKEEKLYPFNETDEGHKTGLVFYKRMRDLLGDRLPPVLVTTVRLDKEILDEFVEGGLHRERFSTKFAIRDVTRFLTKVDSVLEFRPTKREPQPLDTQSGPNNA